MKAIGVLTGLLCLTAAGAAAQMVEPPFYKLDFVVKEVETGKVINSRAYSSMLTASGKDRGSVRTGNRVPTPTGGGSGFNMLDVGINLDFSALRELPTERVVLELAIDITSAAPSEIQGMPPVVRTNQWRSGVILAIKKPTIVFTSDDPSTKRQFQIELTATPLK